MQSYMQYKALGRQLKIQHERNLEKVTAGATDHHVDYRTESRSTTPNPISRSARSSETPSGLSSDISHQDANFPALGPNTGSLDLESNPEPSDSVATSAPAQREPMERRRTQNSMGTNLGNAMTGIDVRRPTTNEGGGEKHVFVVDFQGEDDPMNPHNWSYRKRWGAT